MEPIATEHPIDVASRLLGGRGVLAARYHVRASAVGNWKARGVPDEYAPLIERDTDGAVTCEELCSGKPWSRIPDSTWPHPRGRPVLDYASGQGQAGEGA